MNKLFLLTLLFSSISYADLDIGEDFEAGDLVSAEEFNLKFGKLKKVVGEIKDSDILGVWDCESYKQSINFVDSSYEIANGGNGQVGNGYFYSNSGTITFSELDQESSLNSPKQFSVRRIDVLNDIGHDEGTYSLLLNKFFFLLLLMGVLVIVIVFIFSSLKKINYPLNQPKKVAIIQIQTLFAKRFSKILGNPRT